MEHNFDRPLTIDERLAGIAKKLDQTNLYLALILVFLAGILGRLYWL